MVLKRVLEPEVMDSEKEAQEYNDMDHSVVNQHFVEELFQFARNQDPVAADAEFDFGDVLDLGLHPNQPPSTCRLGSPRSQSYCKKSRSGLPLLTTHGV